jgi:hypothetical protein
MSNRETAVVYKFEVWDHVRGLTIVQPSKRTAESIEQIGGRIIPGTAETIEASRLDRHGRYYPPSMTFMTCVEEPPRTGR